MKSKRWVRWCPWDDRHEEFIVHYWLFLQFCQLNFQWISFILSNFVSFNGNNAIEHIKNKFNSDTLVKLINSLTSHCLASFFSLCLLYVIKSPYRWNIYTNKSALILVFSLNLQHCQHFVLSSTTYRTLHIA